MRDEISRIAQEYMRVNFVDRKQHSVVLKVTELNMESECPGPMIMRISEEARPVRSLTDHPLFTSPAPAVGPVEAEEIVRQHYGFDVSLTPLHSERDTNYLAQAEDRRFILKITNAEEPQGVTDFQTAALLHLERCGPELPTPRLVRALSGEPALSLALAGSRSTVRLLDYLDGVPLKDRPRREFPLAEIGRVLAKLDSALSSFDHTFKQYELLWDSSNLGRLRPLIEYISDPELAKQCQGVIDHFVSNIEPRIADLRWQIIHNDVNLNNILISEASNRVTGIFDFGDIIYAPRINELAVTCSYHICNEIDFAETIGPLVSSYHELTPLDEDEIDVIYDLIVARFVTTISITYWRATMFPANRAYVMRNNPIAVEGLRILQNAGRQSVQQVLRAACNME